jgi:hypothetical protein
MIPFTQYLRPDGERRAVEIDMPPKVEAMAKTFIEFGGYFECEELTTGHVSLTACHPDCEAGDCAIEVVPNGPEVPDAVDRLVKQACEWLKENRNEDRSL